MMIGGDDLGHISKAIAWLPTEEKWRKLSLILASHTELLGDQSLTKLADAPNKLELNSILDNIIHKLDSPAELCELRSLLARLVVLESEKDHLQKQFRLTETKEKALSLLQQLQVRLDTINSMVPL